jgi:hypothetical protein
VTYKTRGLLQYPIIRPDCPDTTAGGLLVPEGIIHPEVVYYIYLLLKFTVPK